MASFKVSQFTGVSDSTDDSLLMLSYTADNGSTYQTRKIRVADFLEGSGGSGGAAGPISLSSYVIEQNYTIPAGTNGASFGDTVVADGFTVEVPEGSTWAIYA